MPRWELTRLLSETGARRSQFSKPNDRCATTENWAGVNSGHWARRSEWRLSTDSRDATEYSWRPSSQLTKTNRRCWSTEDGWSTIPVCYIRCAQYRSASIHPSAWALRTVYLHQLHSIRLHAGTHTNIQARCHVRTYWCFLHASTYGPRVLWTNLNAQQTWQL